MVRFTLNAKAKANDIGFRLKKRLDESLYLLLKTVNELTPENTGTMLENNKVQESRLQGQKLSGKVYNDTPYARKVEDGSPDKIIYSYQKPKGNRGWHVGVGVHGYKRALAALRTTILNYLING